MREEGGAGTELTGNHYLCFPEIARADASVRSASVLSAELGGIVAWEGDPLLHVSIARAGVAPQPMHDLRWERFERWIPHAEFDLDRDTQVDLTICAPGGYEPLARGGFLLCTIHNRGRSSVELDLVLDIRVRTTSLHIATPRALDSTHRLTRAVMHRGIAFESGAPAPNAALGFLAEDPDATYAHVAPDGSVSAVDADVVHPSGDGIHARITMRLDVRPGKAARRAFYIGVGRDRDSAVGHAAHLQRVGVAPLIQEARLELAQITRRIGDVEMSELLNRNLLFNHYFALARAFDDDRLYAVSSRSPKHIPGAAVNEREMLFWTLPAITLTDPLLARELLRDAFELYSAQPGMQWRYLDGGVIEPGFNIEQVLLYPLALDRYVREAKDESLLDDPLVQDVLREIDGGLDTRLHPELLMCDTEVLPDGERADYPYPTLGNVMLYAYARALPRVWRPDEGEPPAGFADGGEEVSTAIWQRCMASVNGAQVFVSTTDLDRASAVYDDPLMSLSLLPFFGFCDIGDPTYRDTMDLLRSKTFPFWRDGVAPGLASRLHPDEPSLAALCADLLGARREAALETVRALQLDDGLASDRYDHRTGRTAGSPHAAALAGFFAWSLLHALSPRAETASSQDRRKKKKKK
jgi:hypothetical protein